MSMVPYYINSHIYGNGEQMLWLLTNTYIKNIATIYRRKNGVFLENQLNDDFLHNLAVIFWVKTAHFFSKFLAAYNIFTS
jgi:hypothetical protein